MIETLIDKLRDLNIGIELAGQDKLKIRSDISKVPGDLLSELRFRKSDLVKYLKEQRSQSNFQLIPNIALQRSYPLSSAQLRLWVLSQLERANVAYIISGVYELEGDLKEEALESSFTALVERHE